MNTKKQNKKKKGFTLIELIIVIAIIAILAAIAIPNFLSIQRKSKVKADIASAKTIYDATSALIAEGKIVPGSTDFGKLDSVTPINDKTNKDVLDLQGYLQTIPTPKSVDNSTFAISITKSESKPEIKVYIKPKAGNAIELYPETQNSEYDLNK
ncbi:prepilin-type N-terminal cleavage/methylation domain-containing protein [Clostridium perfringens]|nr:prepilin-type N-terminal cleavage/methylation domain-containing protein [Clostridium perfringens]HAT4315476.1 prepilin-type N-terminal cleavage/methylation domain-containing protein [Clostridium perfringens]